jgi:hypothetical protein
MLAGTEEQSINGMQDELSGCPLLYTPIFPYLLQLHRKPTVILVSTAHSTCYFCGLQNSSVPAHTTWLAPIDRDPRFGLDPFARQHPIQPKALFFCALGAPTWPLCSPSCRPISQK